MLKQGPLGHSKQSNSVADSPEDRISHQVGFLPDLAPDIQMQGTEAEADSDQTAQGDDGITLVYENHNLDELPSNITESIASCKELRKLSLKGNKLHYMPERLSSLNQLYYLNLSHNRFTEVPSCVADLHSLEILDMSSNALSTLPSFLKKLPQLVGLSLVANNFEILPPVIADLPKLVILEIGDNPIRLPTNIPSLDEAEDEESWINMIRDCIQLHKQELELSLKTSSSKQLNSSTEGPRVSVERLRSSSESGISLRAAKRMGFVMSRNASDQSYMASLHARGSSHDAHMIDAAPITKSGQAQANLEHPLHDKGVVPHQMSSPADNYQHMRSLSTFAATPEYSELQPPPPRSPLSRSPYASPWGSPRPSVTEIDPPSATSNRLSTLAEEHDADSDAADTEVDTSVSTSREPSFSTEAQTTFPPFRRPSNGKSSLPETVQESPKETEFPAASQAQTSMSIGGLFKDSFNETTRMPSSSVSSASSAPAPASGSTHRANSSTPSLPTPTSATASAIESIAFSLEEFGSMLKSISASLPPVILAGVRETQELMANRQWGRALGTFAALLEKLTVPVTFQQVAARLTRRQQRHFATTILLAFPELESAWRQLQRTKLLPIAIDATSHHHTVAHDEQLHTQLDHATRNTQNVVSLLNNVIGKSAVAAADGPEPASEMAVRVRDLSSVCIRCSTASRNVRNLLERQATAHARTLQLSERRRFWEEVNTFLKAVIATLASVKAALPAMPLLKDARVGSEVANLSRVAKEIPPLLEQSSYRVLLDTSGSIASEFEVSALAPSSVSSTSGQNSFNTHHHQLPPLNTQLMNSANSQTSGVSQVSLPPPTPLTASLGAAAQALISPNERAERVDGYIQYGIHSLTEHQ